MNIVIRVDASLLIGSGHVMRCLVLADELKRKGHKIVFACSPLKGDLRGYIGERGFDVVTLSTPRVEMIPKHDADYVSWLQKSIVEDAHDFLVTITSADLVITDHYAIDREWQNLVIESLNCRLVAIDDLARNHRADLILDQTLGRSELDYRESESRVLAGSQYALLHQRFSSKRELALSRAFTNQVPKVLVSMGGVDTPNATLKVLEVLHNQVSANFTVLLSSRAPHFQEVQAWSRHHANVSHIEFVSDMASLMLDHDVAIGAPGTTSWERACLGLPSIVVPLADNQKMICSQLIKHDAARKVEIEDISECLLNEYQALLKQWEEHKRANLALCDGRGIKRVVYEIQQLLEHSPNSLSLSFASHQDIELVYQWQCHPETRKHALTTAVPTWHEHQEWMINKLQSVTDYFYMVVEHSTGAKVGAIRLDRVHAGHYLVSIFVDPENYGKGIAFKALSIVDEIHPDITIHATVLKANIASQKLFQKARYQKIDAETYLRQPID